MLEFGLVRARPNAIKAQSSPMAKNFHELFFPCLLTTGVEKKVVKVFRYPVKPQFQAVALKASSFIPF